MNFSKMAQGTEAVAVPYGDWFVHEGYCYMRVKPGVEPEDLDHAVVHTVDCWGQPHTLEFDVEVCWLNNTDGSE